MYNINKKNIVISAVNLIEGGTFTILKKCLDYLETDIQLQNEYHIIALVHNKKLFSYKNIELIEFPNSKKNWLFRIYYEYYGFYKLSLKFNVYLWFSLHDMTPNVKAKYRAVYCHNSTPFYETNIKDLKYSYKVFLFSIFYKYLYKINITRNTFVVVQQNWLKDAFCKLYNLNKEKIIVSYPQENEKENNNIDTNFSYDGNTFFFPSLPRIFKNFEVVCKATEYLLKKNINNFEVILTINGTENAYSKSIYKKYKNCPNIKFVGLLSHNEMTYYYNKTKCLIFPSKLESWGLPISEFLIYNRPMIVADLPYAYETVSGAKQVAFFNPNDYVSLASFMEDVINNNLNKFRTLNLYSVEQPYTHSWKELFDILLDKKTL